MDVDTRWTSTVPLMWAALALKPAIEEYIEQWRTTAPAEDDFIALTPDQWDAVRELCTFLNDWGRSVTCEFRFLFFTDCCPVVTSFHHAVGGGWLLHTLVS